MESEYTNFLASKLLRDVSTGFDVTSCNSKLFAWQADLVRWSCQRGRAAIFADCGLGKTAMQLEWSRLVVEHSGRHVMILAPLNVVEQTCREADKFGIDACQARSQSEVPVEASVVVANYEMLEHFDASSFAGVVLDESSILKSFTGSTKRMLCELFKDTPFRLCCTATPAPNDHKELGNHADFLGVMPSNEMLARWFVNDPMQAGNYRMKGHAEDDFWRWVTTWAASCGAPSDLGYPDDGFVLPELEVVHCAVDTPPDLAFKQGALFSGAPKPAHARRSSEAAHDVWLIVLSSNRLTKSGKELVPWISDVPCLSPKRPQRKSLAKWAINESCQSATLTRSARNFAPVR